MTFDAMKLLLEFLSIGRKINLYPLAVAAEAECLRVLHACTVHTSD
jgi:hypothetical protein